MSLAFAPCYWQASPVVRAPWFIPTTFVPAVSPAAASMTLISPAPWPLNPWTVASVPRGRTSMTRGNVSPWISVPATIKARWCFLQTWSPRMEPCGVFLFTRRTNNNNIYFYYYQRESKHNNFLSTCKNGRLSCLGSLITDEPREILLFIIINKEDWNKSDINHTEMFVNNFPRCLFSLFITHDVLQLFRRRTGIHRHRMSEEL